MNVVLDGLARGLRWGREQRTDVDIENERALCEEAGIEFLSFPIPDKEAPASLEGAEVFAQQLAGRVLEGRPVAIHTGYWSAIPRLNAAR